MVCCLNTLWSIRRISVRLTHRASIKLTTIRTYSTISRFHQIELFPPGTGTLPGDPWDDFPSVLGLLRLALSARFLLLPGTSQ
jgi:hypothetical protein